MVKLIYGEEKVGQKKEGNVTMLPELYDLFLKNVERKHQFPIAMPWKNTV